jgi:hypothetical protein
MDMVTRIRSLLGAVLLVAATTGAPAQDSDEDGQRASKATAKAPVSEEYLLLGNAMRGAGEPMIAVDPTNTNNIIAVAMGSIQQIGGKPSTRNSTELYHTIPRSTITWLAVTHDGGANWTVGEFPILAGDLARCPDSFADVTKDGVFIGGCEPRTTIDPDDLGMSAMRLSTDKGNNWGPVVQIISDFQLQRFAPALRPISGAWPKNDPKRVASNSPWDRPFTYIDDSTGIIYGQAGGGRTEVGAPPGKWRSQAYVTASVDGGRSFGTIYSWDSPQWPQLSRGLSMSAGHGVVAVTYVASRVPASQRAACPCPVLGLSRDRGRTFTYRVLPNIHIPPGTNDPRANGGLSKISIDQTKAGRIAMLRGEGPDLSVSVSDDWGAHWSSFANVGKAPRSVSTTKHAFEFSRDGVLGVMWRAIYPDQSYDIWAAISRDGGKTFSEPLRVSHARSPAFDPYRNAGRFGDDIQDFSMDRTNMHMVWGDSRAGFQGVFYGKVALSAFEF